MQKKGSASKLFVLVFVSSSIDPSDRTLRQGSLGDLTSRVNATPRQCGQEDRQRTLFMHLAVTVFEGCVAVEAKQNQAVKSRQKPICIQSHDSTGHDMH